VRPGHRKFLVAAVLAVALPLRAAREIAPGFNFFSKEHDIQLGKETARQVEKQMRLVSDPALGRYVSELGTRLAKASQAPDYPYTFRIVAQKGINAFALPGGPIYIHAATIAATDSEAQLAGVMAHEISHVALRHGTNQVSKAFAWQIPLLLAGAVLNSDNSLLGQLAQLGVGLGVNSVLLKYSRDAEHDADVVGAYTMAKAGYDPVDMARFFQKLEREPGGGQGLQFLSDHPNPGNRVKYVQDEVKSMPPRRYTAASPDFARMKGLAARIPVAEAPRELGAAPRRPPARPEPPSSQFNEFLGSGFRVSHPANWRSHASEGGQAVTIAPPQGLSQGQVGVGAMAGYFSPRSNNLREATDELVRDLTGKNPGLQVRGGERRRVTVDGSNGELLRMTGVSPLGDAPEIDVLLAVTRPQGLFFLILIAPESDYSSVQKTFDQMQSSVRFR
jgi:Zn-dependent protease with chaperone function